MFVVGAEGRVEFVSEHVRNRSHKHVTFKAEQFKLKSYTLIDLSNLAGLVNNNITALIEQ